MMLSATCEPILRSDADDPTLDLIAALLSAFNRAHIAYCYWKSSQRLMAVLGGDADLDLLVAKQDQHRAASVLLDCGYKPFAAVPQRDHPSVASFLGFDEPSGRIVHVHLHLRLVVGERLLKNYVLPWERSILAHAALHPIWHIRMLDPASEAVLCAVRTCLELRLLDPITLRNLQATRDKFAADRTRLAARIDREALWQRAAEWTDAATAELLADACSAAPAPGTGTRLGRRLRPLLAPHRMYNAPEARLRAMGRALHWLAGGLNKRHLQAPRPWSRRAPGGGCVIALLGVDGSGKTTLVRELRAWLSAEIDVAPIYFGTGDGRPSLLLLPLKLMLPLLGAFSKSKPQGSSHGTVSSRRPGVLYSALLVIWSTVLAAEKRSKLHAAHRGAQRGLVVIADRYPQDEILSYNDGPLLPRLRGVPGWLRRFEARAYALARRLPPDLVIKLEAPPETLARREPTMDLAVIHDRVGAVKRLIFPGARVVCIDATQPLADVIRAAKREIWRML